MSWFNNYVGIPYEHLGRSSNGADCYGLVRLALLENFQIQIPELTTESAPTERALRKELLALRRNWVKVEDTQEGDAIIFRIAGGANHVGIVIGVDSLFLHTEPRKNAVIESWKSPYWKHLVDSVWRHKSKCLHS